MSDKKEIVSASPKVRKLARDFGADLYQIQGSQREGRVSEADVKSHIKESLSGKIEKKQTILSQQYEHLDFGDVEDMKLPTFRAGGGTPMGEATLEALDMLEDRKKQYKKNAVTYWQPWLVLMTDGAATDGEHALPNKVAMAAEKTCDLVKNKKLTLFSIIIEPGTPDELEKFCGKLAPLDGVKFEEFFVWLRKKKGDK